MKFIPCYPDFFQKKAGGGGISAIALYDYQAMAEDEISFDPNDVITNIEMVGCFSPMQCQVLSSFILVSMFILHCRFCPLSRCPCTQGGRGLVDRRVPRQVRTLPRQLRGGSPGAVTPRSGGSVTTAASHLSRCEILAMI